MTLKLGEHTLENTTKLSVRMRILLSILPPDRLVTHFENRPETFFRSVNNTPLAALAVIDDLLSGYGSYLLSEKIPKLRIFPLLHTI